MQHLMFEADEGAHPGLWRLGWVCLGSSYPVNELSEDLLRDMNDWVDAYIGRAYLSGESMEREWFSAGYLLVARANVQLMPRGFAVWPAFQWTPGSLVPLEMRADFREERLAISDAQMQRLVESSNELLAAHHLPLIPAGGSDGLRPTDA